MSFAQVIQKLKVEFITNDEQLFDTVLSECSLTDLVENREKYEKSVTKAEKAVLQQIVDLLETCYEVDSPKDYAQISSSELKETMTKELGIDFSETLFLMPIVTERKPSFKRSKKLMAKEKEPGPSSITQKKRKQDTSTSSTDVYTTAVIAGARHLVESESSDDELDTLLSSTLAAPKRSGPTGSSISLKKNENLYTWKLPAWTSAQSFVDLKIYPNPNTLPEKDPMQWWREASFRAKVLIGTTGSNPQRTEKIQNCLSKLTTLLIADVASDPSVQSQCQK